MLQRFLGEEAVQANSFLPIVNILLLQFDLGRYIAMPYVGFLVGQEKRKKRKWYW